MRKENLKKLYEAQTRKFPAELCIDTESQRSVLIGKRNVGDVQRVLRNNNLEKNLKIKHAISKIICKRGWKQNNNSAPTNYLGLN